MGFEFLEVLPRIQNDILIAYSSLLIPTRKYLYQLKPYPYYHLEHINLDAFSSNILLFPQHWRNLHKTPLLTMADQSIANSMIFPDTQKGQYKFNGLPARLVVLFAEKFNATLEMALPITLGETIHISRLHNPKGEGRLNMPMILYPGFDGKRWLHMSYPIIVGKWMVALPSAQRLKIKEVYKLS